MLSRFGGAAQGQGRVIFSDRTEAAPLVLGDMNVARTNPIDGGRKGLSFPPVAQPKGRIVGPCPSYGCG